MRHALIGVTVLLTVVILVFITKKAAQNSRLSEYIHKCYMVEFIAVELEGDIGFDVHREEVNCP